MKTTMWALVLGTMTATLVGCGEKGTRPPQAEPVATAPIVAVPSATPSACVSACPMPPVTIVAAPTAVAAPSAPPAKPKVKAASEPTLTVKRLVVAQGVKGHEPVDAGTTFTTNEAKKLYAFVEVENGEQRPGEITVAFEPADGSAARGNVELEIGASPRWRTWAYTRAARTAGAWNAVVRNRRGEVLARVPFEITL